MSNAEASADGERAMILKTQLQIILLYFEACRNSLDNADRVHLAAEFENAKFNNEFQTTTFAVKWLPGEIRIDITSEDRARGRSVSVPKDIIDILREILHRDGHTWEPIWGRVAWWMHAPDGSIPVVIRKFNDGTVRASIFMEVKCNDVERKHTVATLGVQDVLRASATQ